MNTNLIIRHTRFAAIAAASVLTLAACSTETAGDAGVDLIEGDLADQLELGPLDGTCEEPAAEEADETFECTATTEAGDTIELSGIMVAEDEILLGASNALLPEDFEVLEADATATVATTFEVDPTSVSVVCPDVTTILVDDQASCELTDASDGTTYELIITMLPFVAGEGFSGSEYEVGNVVS